MELVIVTIIIILLIAIYCKKREGFLESQDCQNLILHKGNHLYLYNTYKADIPGVNPIVFNNLDEYVQYLKWQRSMGIRCPVLHFKEIQTTQGVRKVQAIPDPTDPNSTMPSQPTSYEELLQTPGFTKLYDAARTNNKLYNQNMRPSYDPQNQYIGVDTPIDKLFHEDSGVSANPMDANWGGVKYSKKQVKLGKYKGDQVFRPKLKM